MRASILSRRGVLPRPVLNRLGLQVGRVLLSRVGSRARQLRASTADAPERAIRDQGFSLVEDFLDPSAFSALHAEFWRVMRDPLIPKRRIQDNRGFVRETFYVEPGGPAPVCTDHIYENLELRRLLRCSEGVSAADFGKAEFQVSFWRQWLDENICDDAEQSDHSNTNFHADTFYTISKAFLYIEPTDSSNGAHRYVPRSHRLSRARLAFEYRNSVRDPRASPRVALDQLQQYGEPPQSFDLGGNALIVENTFGFHAAGDIAPGRERNLVYVQFRWPPFGRFTRPGE